MQTAKYMKTACKHNKNLGLKLQNAPQNVTEKSINCIDVNLDLKRKFSEEHIVVFWI